jgi:hypothetical protein
MERTLENGIEWVISYPELWVTSIAIDKKGLFYRYYSLPLSTAINLPQS